MLIVIIVADIVIAINFHIPKKIVKSCWRDIYDLLCFPILDAIAVIINNNIQWDYFQLYFGRFAQ